MSLAASCRLRLAFNAALWNPTKEEWSRLGSFIQAEEREKISQFYYKDDAKIRLACRLLIRYALSRTTKLNWKDLKLFRDERDKPYLDPHLKTNIFFNASHQGDYVVVVTDTVNVGVDVMDVRESHGDLENFFKLMNRQFTPSEWTIINQPETAKEKMKAFYRNWCLKESFVKALGIGISYPLLSLNFQPQCSLYSWGIVTSSLLFIDGKVESDWSFEESMIDDNHVVAVARNFGPLKTSCLFNTVTINDILRKTELLEACSEIDDVFENCFYKPDKPRRKQL
ncbi:unnamed protein product [Clavelina lepadiformis]|uniref:L-aminoadipate-semialdehyde dehydrogenase-phosphopantetheinyl transferase n=1 Tax=Clavelina lepadiformis TaxID=159417 RepID=A0ABP0GQL4_CLALP